MARGLHRRTGHQPRLTTRQEHERLQRRRSSFIAAASTFVVLVAVVVLVPRMPRWDRVKQSFFDVDKMRDSFPRLIDAFWLDVKIFAWTTPAIFGLALLIALARNSR